MSAALAVCLLSVSFTVFARIPRSTTAINDFKRVNPCPVTGAWRGSCPGWEVDHVVALCAGGPDTPKNMQWLTRSDHRKKTKLDVMKCRLNKSNLGTDR